MPGATIAKVKGKHAWRPMVKWRVVDRVKLGYVSHGTFHGEINGHVDVRKPQKMQCALKKYWYVQKTAAELEYNMHHL